MSWTTSGLIWLSGAKTQSGGAGPISVKKRAGPVVVVEVFAQDLDQVALAEDRRTYKSNLCHQR